VKKPTVSERRTEILETTCEVVIERGFAATRIADVAKRLDVSSSLIHYHFDSKEQLLAEAFEHYARKDLAEMEAEFAAAPTSVDKLDRVIQNYVPEGSDDVEWMLWIDAWGEALRNPLMRRISQELDEQSTALLERVIRLGVESGDFVCADPAAAAMRLAAVVDGLAVQFAAHSGMMSRAQFIEHVRTLAAWEVGLEPDVFHRDGPQVQRSLDASPMTDLALRRLVARWGDAVARQDLDTCLSCLTDDAVWDFGEPVVGRGAIAAALEKAFARSSFDVPLTSNELFVVDEVAGTGSGRITVVERRRRKKGEVTTLVGLYHDRYRRVGGAWFVCERRLEVRHEG